MKARMIQREHLVELAREAGQVALRHYGRARGRRKQDRSLVSAADEEVEAFLRGKLRAAAPRMPIISEERYAAGERQRIGGAEWIAAVDPIDGTSAFLHQVPTWSISIGLLRHGHPVRGVIHLPCAGEIVSADEEGVFRNGRPVVPETPRTLDAESVLLVPSTFHRRHLLVDFPGKTRSLGSIAYHLALVARGASIGALMGGRTHIWDVAGGLAATHAGGIPAVYVEDGAPLDLSPFLEGGTPGRPFLVAPSRHLDRLRRAIRRGK